MKRILLAVGAVAIVASAHAQYGSYRNYQWGSEANAEYNITWDPTNVVEVRGDIMFVDRLTTQEGGANGYRLWLKTPYGPVVASIGPNWYLNQTNNVIVKPHDTVWVIGSKVSQTGFGFPILLTQQLRTATRTWAFRNDRGMPFWSGMNMSDYRTTTSGNMSTNMDMDRWYTDAGKDVVWMSNSSYNRLWDDKTAQDWTGRVVRVENMSIPGSTYPATVAWVKVGNDTIPVHLGPAWWVGHQGYVLRPDQEITFHGSRVMFNETPIVFVTSVNRGGTTWMFRDDSGRPLWIRMR